MSSNYLNPFDVFGIKVSIMGDKLVRVYHDSIPLSDSDKAKIDNVVQYLMDEGFVSVETCRVEVFTPKS